MLKKKVCRSGNQRFPSSKLTVCDIEHGPVEIVDLPIENSDFAILNGKINYFYGHVLCRKLLIYQ